jgi:hypothetical protein
MYLSSFQNFENIVNPILMKPKPKADPPPPVNKENCNTAEKKDGQEDSSPKQEQQSDEKMDVE